MTQTLDQPTTAPSAADARVSAWLVEFEAALVARDIDRAAGMFATQSF